jgi:2-oxoglutarate/2-oxoacid ferredoxin oxidoreductase subunit alpha
LPEEQVQELAGRVKGFVTVEINLGQIHLEVMRAAAGKVPCHLVGHAGGTIIAPDQVIAKLKEASSDASHRPKVTAQAKPEHPLED